MPIVGAYSAVTCAACNVPATSKDGRKELPETYISKNKDAGFLDQRAGASTKKELLIKGLMEKPAGMPLKRSLNLDEKREKKYPAVIGP